MIYNGLLCYWKIVRLPWSNRRMEIRLSKQRDGVGGGGGGGGGGDGGGGGCGSCRACVRV